MADHRQISVYFHCPQCGRLLHIQRDIDSRIPMNRQASHPQPGGCGWTGPIPGLNPKKK